jgi:hypothetical protein
MYIFIDESGDLGFDFSKNRPSKYFTITLLVCESEHPYKAIKHAVLKTLKRKINYSNKRNHVHELKGSYTSIKTKQYFLSQMPNFGWCLYAITVNKQKVHSHLQSKTGKNKLYNFITRELLKKFTPPKDLHSVSIIIDKSKNREDRKDFNNYIKTYLEAAFSLGTQIYITHENSASNPGLQAVDMFCWGIQQKETTGNHEWLELYQDRVAKHIKLFYRKKVPTPSSS